jgi:hypothetical protein
MSLRTKLSCITLAICLPFAQASAKENTEVESFIRHVQENTQFVTVNNIWQTDPNFDQTALLQKVDKAQPLTIDYTKVAGFMQQKNTGINLVVPGIGGGSYTIDLARFDFLSNSFKVHTMGADGNDVVVDYTPGLYYRGVVEGIPGSVAAFSFFNNEVYGVFSIPGEGNYTLVPNTMTGSYYGSNQHYILYNDHDLKIKAQGPGCATDQLPDLHTAERTTSTLVGNDVYTNCTEVRVFEFADYATYLSKGSNTTTVTNYLTALFNNQATLYRNEGIGIVMQNVLINTATDAYQSLGDNSTFFLDRFGYLIQNTYKTTYASDMAVCFSTRYGDMGGVAWIQQLCSNYFSTDSAGAYAFCNIDNSAVVNFPTFSWDVEVSTHEMGHVLGSPHTHRCCWNPPGTGTTAIDGCYTLEGTCAMPVPQYPVGGGTIMSYCHLTSDGINFSNGFGSQPGDTVRYYIAHKFSATCGVHYTPTTALSTANRTISANRECTDIASGDTTTYYFYDNLTASHADDTLVLIVQKHGNSIGDLNTSGFSVKSTTIARYGSGRGDTLTFPAGSIHSIDVKNIAMRRFWTIAGATTPTTAVDVLFPFLLADTADVDGSVPGGIALSNYRMYKVNSPIDPNPANNLVGATYSTLSQYTYGSPASTSHWALTTVGTTNFADMKMTNLNGGGTGFYTYGPAGVATISTNHTDVVVYPNPTHDQWSVSVANLSSNSALSFQLYTADGRLVKAQPLQNGQINTIDASILPTGIYYYRVTNNNIAVSTGSLTKK